MASSRLLVIFSIFTALLLTAGACSKSQAPAAAENAAPAAAAPASTPPAPAPAAPEPSAMAAHAPTASASAPASESVVTGKVLETMDAGGYTYVQLDTPSGKIWAATSPIKVQVGQLLTVPLEMPMSNFHSKALGRDFPLIYFASRVAHGSDALPARPPMPTADQRAAAGAPDAQAAGGQAPQGQMPPGHPPVGAGSAPVTVTERIAAPAGGHAIAEVWAKRASLDGKTVTVRGKVVKYLGGIMGKNWIHLQDGSGNAKDGTNDLTVTTDAAAKVGDVVTATGTLAVDKDFGAGYKYGAIVEGASIKP